VHQNAPNCVLSNFPGGNARTPTLVALRPDPRAGRKGGEMEQGKGMEKGLERGEKGREERARGKMC